MKVPLPYFHILTSAKYIMRYNISHPGIIGITGQAFLKTNIFLYPFNSSDFRTLCGSWTESQDGSEGLTYVAAGPKGVALTYLSQGQGSEKCSVVLPQIFQMWYFIQFLDHLLRTYYGRRCDAKLCWIQISWNVIVVVKSLLVQKRGNHYKRTNKAE